MTGEGVLPAWLPVIRRYLLAAGAGNLVWEFAQMPLYTLWHGSTWRQILFAALHCTAGDLGIAAGALALALALAGASDWPDARFIPVLLATTGLGTGYTVYSEHLNVIVRQAWAYAPAMPVLPGLGTGLAPLTQWLVVPPLALLWSRRGAAPPASVRTRESDMYGNGFMGGGMFWGMGLLWLLLLVLVGVGIIALAKYIFGGWRRD